MQVACFSVAAIDYFPQKDRFYAGGNALNQAIRMSAQGAKCAFLGALGNDTHGKKLLALLSKGNVDISQLKVLEGHTATNRIVNNSSGERFGEEGAWCGGVYENYMLPDESWRFIKDFEIWTTHSTCPNFPITLTKKKDNFLCVDYLELPDEDVLLSTVDRVDIAYIGGDATMIDMLIKLSKKTPSLIVLTLGAEGSMAFLNGNHFTQKSIPANTVVDTTGCGDAFQSGFTYSYFVHRDIKQALLAGAKMGHLATMHYGGVEW